jgi:hypothetical protein
VTDPRLRHLTWRQRQLLDWMRTREPIWPRDVTTHSDGRGALQRLAGHGFVRQDRFGGWWHVGAGDRKT